MVMMVVVVVVVVVIMLAMSTELCKCPIVTCCDMLVVDLR